MPDPIDPNDREAYLEHKRRKWAGVEVSREEVAKALGFDSVEEFDRWDAEHKREPLSPNDTPIR